MSLTHKIIEALFRGFLPRTHRGRQARIDRHYQVGVSLYIHGRYDDSEREFLKMIETSQESGAHAQLPALTLKSVGDFYHNNGHYSRAEPLYKQSLELIEKDYPEGHKRILTGLNDLALLHYLQGRYEDSEVLYLGLLKLLEEHLGPDHGEVAICLENYAAVLRKFHRDKESDELKARAKSIRKGLDRS